MLKQEVTYENYDGETVTDVLHFNLAKHEMGDNLHLVAEFEALQNQLTVEDRNPEMTPEEIKEMLRLVKQLIKLAYGVRDGNEFDKNPEHYERFVRTAAFDAFLFQLFEDPEAANNFMAGVLPKDMRDKALAAMATGPTTVSLPPGNVFDNPVDANKQREIDELNARLEMLKNGETPPMQQ